MAKKLLKALIDLEFDGSMNEFEEFYGDSMTYQQVEQESYIDFKHMVNNAIGKIKFRKVRDISRENSLTCRLILTAKQYEKFKAIYNGEVVDKEKSTESNTVYKKFSFLHKFKIHNLRLEESTKDKK